MTLISKHGISIASKNILQEKGALKWCIREEQLNPNDNGWRFLSAIDTSEFIADSNNMGLVNADYLAEIEPAILAILDLPVGTDITLIRENGQMFFVHTGSGEMVEFE